MKERWSMDPKVAFQLDSPRKRPFCGRSTNHHKQMDTFDPIRYKHLPKFGQFIHWCYFPNKSVNHSETPYTVPEDYKNDDDFLQHYHSLRLSRNTNFIDLFSACPQYFYNLEYYKAYAYNQP